MVPYFTEKFGNAASRQHRLGWEAQEAVERARAEVAALIGADAKEIVWTSGATEANNLALKGLAEVARPRRNHFVTVVTEHKSVLDTCKRLEQQGCRTTVLGVEPDGSVDLDALRSAVTDETAAVSVTRGEQRDWRAGAAGGDCRRSRTRRARCCTPTPCRRSARCRST